MALDREAIRVAQDRKLEEVEVEEWGGSIYFGSLPLGKRNELIERWAGLDQNEDIAEATNVQLDLVMAVACDEDGVPTFTDEDRDLLLQKNAAVVERLAFAAMDFLGMTKEAHEETVGNSGSAPSESSSSD